MVTAGNPEIDIKMFITACTIRAAIWIATSQKFIQTVRQYDKAFVFVWYHKPLYLLGLSWSKFKNFLLTNGHNCISIVYHNQVQNVNN